MNTNPLDAQNSPPSKPQRNINFLAQEDEAAIPKASVGIETKPAIRSDSPFSPKKVVPEAAKPTRISPSFPSTGSGASLPANTTPFIEQSPMALPHQYAQQPQGQLASGDPLPINSNWPHAYNPYDAPITNPMAHTATPYYSQNFAQPIPHYTTSAGNPTLYSTSPLYIAPDLANEFGLQPTIPGFQQPKRLFNPYANEPWRDPSIRGRYYQPTVTQPLQILTAPTASSSRPNDIPTLQDSKVDSPVRRNLSSPGESPKKEKKQPSNLNTGLLNRFSTRTQSMDRQASTHANSDDAVPGSPGSETSSRSSSRGRKPQKLADFLTSRPSKSLSPTRLSSFNQRGRNSDA